jgi:periplasmic protein TonB
MAANTTFGTSVHQIPKVKEKARTSIPCEVPLPPQTAAAKFAGANIRLFEDSMLENERLLRLSRPAELLVAFLVHALPIAVPILAGLYFTDSLDMRAFPNTLLVALPPPPPPPAAPAVAGIKAQAPKRVFVQQGKLLAPTYIPKQIAQIKEAPQEADLMGGVEGGVPGGVPGGQLGGVIGGIVGSNGQTRVPVPSIVGQSRAPVRVGGKIRPPRILVKTTPMYPSLARATKTQGMVEIEAIIDPQGNVIEMRAVSGPPLLIHAALEAVKTWKYEPTYLNDTAIAVELIVTVTFQLDQ